MVDNIIEERIGSAGDKFLTIMFDRLRNRSCERNLFVELKNFRRPGANSHCYANNGNQDARSGSIPQIHKVS
jgi:hypothetical protein